MYSSYLLAGFRFPLNSFYRGLFHRLGIGSNQLNPNGWRTVVVMQVLWREALEGNCPITVDEFLYYYKPSDIKRSTGFYQFSSKGSYYSLIKGRSSSDRLWKTEFFIIFGNWAGDPVDVRSAPFPPFTSPIGRLRLEGMFSFQFISFLFYLFSTFNRLTLLFIDATVIRSRLDKFYLDQIDQVCAFPGRTFHDLVTLSRLAAWGLGPLPTAENLSHEETIRRSEYRPFVFSLSSLFLFFGFCFNLIFLIAGIITMRENKEKNITSRDEDVTTPPVIQKSSVQAGKRKAKPISTAVDLDDLPSRRGPKKQKPVKVDKASLPKIPKFVPPMVNLDESPVDVEPVQTIHPIQTEPTPQTKIARKPPSSEPSDRPSNLVLDENYAWRTFKRIVIDNEVNECYNMSIKEFERSGIHDLFKVSFIHPCVFSVSFQNKKSNFPSSMYRLC